VFLDRDGTIIVDTSYIGDPAKVQLIPGAAAAIARLNQARIPVIVVSNQSGIGRELFTMDDYRRVERRVEEALAECGARLDAVYICPHAPDEDEPCECRKPGTKLFRDAAAQSDLDLAQSWYAGDRWRDVEPAIAFGGRPALVPADSTPRHELERAAALGAMFDSLASVVDDVLKQDGVERA
jgi:histidinol-phosphate phosphatase family protein